MTPTPAFPPEAPRYSVLELCKNRAGFEAAPTQKLNLDLADVKRRAEHAGWEVLADAGIILVLGMGLVEASVFESGKLLFKTKDEGQAAAAMGEFFRLMGWTA
ncbi:MAG TPA: hypothetical protein VNZ52_11130 [Candidatus Thermoplasmatota archaeon]|nr:hypothetical protein [Candidatus Thermoplasmatota archaeon]